MKKRILTFAICLLLIIPAAIAFADDSSGLLSPSGSSVTAGNGLGFKLDLSAITEDYGSYTVTINISPAPEKLSLSENVNMTMNQVNGTYSVSSSDLSSVTALNFTVYPDSTITSQQTYSVSAHVAGEGGTSMEDSFSFSALPAKSSDSDENKSSDDSKTKGGQAGVAKSASAVGSSSSTSSSSVSYEGSADNYLDKLSVFGQKFTHTFNKTRDTYFINTSDSISSLDVSATPSDSSADVDISGNKDLSENRNKIQINVTADNGDVRIYRIYLINESE